MVVPGKALSPFYFAAEFLLGFAKLNTNLLSHPVLLFRKCDHLANCDCRIGEIAIAVAGMGERAIAVEVKERSLEG
jgi:hypothetical protein